MPRPRTDLRDLRDSGAPVSDGPVGSLPVELDPWERFARYLPAIAFGGPLAAQGLGALAGPAAASPGAASLPITAANPGALLAASGASSLPLAAAPGALGALPAISTLPITAANPSGVLATSGASNLSLGGAGRGILDALGGWRGLINYAGRGLSALQRGRAEGRAEEAEAARLYDYLNLARTRSYYDRAGQELDQRRFAQDLQTESFGNATRGAFLQNYARPASSAPAAIAPFVGTPRPGLETIPQSTRNQLGGAMYRNAITELLDPLQPGTATSGRRMAALPEPEPLSPTPEAGGVDTFLNYAGLFGAAFADPREGSSPPRQPLPQPAPPPAQAPVTRTTPPPARSNPVTGEPSYVGDVPRSVPSITSLMTSPSPYSAPTSSTSMASSGLTTPAPLPPISDLVGPVPGPTAPLSDPYETWRRRQQGRA